MSVAVPTPDERTSIRQFCVLHRNMEEQTRTLKRDKTLLAAEKKTDRDRMYDYMKEKGQEVCAFTRADGSTGFVVVKAYSNQKAVNEQLLKDAIDDITHDDVTMVLAEMDSPTMQEGIKAVIAKALHQTRSTKKEYVDVVKSAPKGKAVSAVPTDEELKQIASTTTTRTVLPHRKDLKGSPPTSRTRSLVRGEIANYMSRRRSRPEGEPRRDRLDHADLLHPEAGLLHQTATQQRLVARIVSESVDTVLSEHRDVEAFFTHRRASSSKSARGSMRFGRGEGEDHAEQGR